MKNKLLLFIFFTVFAGTVKAQEPFTGGNQCFIRIETDKYEYQFNTTNMSARLNDTMDRFEFIIPLKSILSLRDSSDMKFIRSMANGSENIIINAALPDDNDAQLDLSYFKGNQSIELAGDLTIGKFKFEDDIDFNGMLMANDERMTFNFSIFINTRAMPISKVNNEQLMEIEMGAKGDKIIGLTTN